MKRRTSRGSRGGRLVARPNARTREKALDALGLLRKGMTLRTAAKTAGTSPASVHRYVGRALDHTASGRVVAKPTDSYERSMHLITERGRITVMVKGSRAASRISAYDDAVKHFLRTGSTSRLRPFRGQAIRTGKVAHPFITNPNTLRRLGYAGELSFESIYALRG